MSELVLTLKGRLPDRVDMSGLVPDRIGGKTTAQVAKTEVVCGGQRVPAGDLFDIRGTPGETMVIRGDGSRLDRTGAGMARGTLRVEGDVGRYLGTGLAGGTVRVEGDAGDSAAAGMTGGLLDISGNAGAFLGAALPGEQAGMTGGVVIVRGNAGDRAGDRMRRGLIVVGADTGDYCGTRMRAGTIVVLGRVGTSCGFAMSRGTLLLGTPSAHMLATFNDCGTHDLLFLRLLHRQLQTVLGDSGQTIPSGTRARRYVGDLAGDGKGEILVYAG